MSGDSNTSSGAFERSADWLLVWDRDESSWVFHLEVGQHRTAHEDGDLLHNLDARVPRLPGLFALANGFEERQERRNAEGAGHNRECPGCGVPHVLIDIVNIRTHGCNHGRQACSLQAVHLR